MYSIVGVLGSGPAASPIIEALKRLENRGHDSAGVATLENGRIERRREGASGLSPTDRLPGKGMRPAVRPGNLEWALDYQAHPGKLLLDGFSSKSRSR
jgi:glucosamine--fructose-6-phosphate aminotransferase (isomerizing)